MSDSQQLPRYLRFDDLKRAGIVDNRMTLANMIGQRGFPVGVRLTPNRRAWLLSDVEQWLALRPTEPRALRGSALQRKQKSELVE